MNKVYAIIESHSDYECSWDIVRHVFPEDRLHEAEYLREILASNPKNEDVDFSIEEYHFTTNEEIEHLEEVNTRKYIPGQKYELLETLNFVVYTKKGYEPVEMKAGTIITCKRLSLSDGRYPFWVDENGKEIPDYSFPVRDEQLKLVKE